MIYLKNVICAAALLALCVPAMAINKCTGPDGQTTFQDAPCAGKGAAIVVRPASGNAPTAAMPAATAGAAQPGKPQTEAQRIEAQITSSQQDRRKLELETRFRKEPGCWR